MTEIGRSGADAPSGCQPTASAAEGASSQSGIPNAVPLSHLLAAKLKRLTRRTKIDRDTDRISGDVGL